MRTYNESYDKMLCSQADVTFAFEEKILCCENWRAAQRVLDIGCGNGYYIHSLSQRYPDKTYIGIDSNSELIQIANTNYHQENITFLLSDFLSFEPEEKFDFIIIRLVLSHLSNRNDFYCHIKEITNPEACIMIVDADDENFYIYPELDNFLKGINDCRSQIEVTGNRKLKRLVSGEFEQHGFSLLKYITFAPNSMNDHQKAAFYRYMIYTAECQFGDPLSANLYRELFEWFCTENSFAQYGLFVAIFKKGDI